MQYEELLLPNTSSGPAIDAAIATLGRIAGVRAATRAPDSYALTVQFDEQATSPAAIRAALAQAGHALAQPKAGGCCGACGG